MIDDSDDDVPQLAGDTLAALKEFYAERDVQQQRFEDLKAGAEKIPGKLSIETFTEDWNASQFWHTEATASTLARQLLKDLRPDSAIAVISTPSTYVQLHNMLLDAAEIQKPGLVKLLEFDDRFAVLKDFVRYDFNRPFDLPADLKGRFDRVIVDPPFLSEDCQTKMAMTTRWLLNPSAVKNSSHRTLICTGERMRDLVLRAYPGCRTTNFQLEHNKGRLSNEFICYANFQCEDWSWSDT